MLSITNKFKMPGFLKDMDMFGAKVPTINLEGGTRVKTPAGACCSLWILIVTFVYAFIKLLELIELKNPALNEY